MKNAAMPYAIIAILAIVAVIIISVVGLNNRADIAEGDNTDTEQTENGGEEGATAEVDVDSVYQTNCAMCHGSELSNGSAPDLSTVGASLSQDEIKEIIQNGTDGGMPAIPAVAGEELEALSSWLSEQQ
ncbi:c-type cytochrome [Oceanobacillus sp. CAU 1775]